MTPVRQYLQRDDGVRTGRVFLRRTAEGRILLTFQHEERDPQPAASYEDPAAAVEGLMALLENRCRERWATKDAKLRAAFRPVPGFRPGTVQAIARKEVAAFIANWTRVTLGLHDRLRAAGWPVPRPWSLPWGDPAAHTSNNARANAALQATTRRK